MQLHSMAQIHQHAPKHMSKNQRPWVQQQEAEGSRVHVQDVVWERLDSVQGDTEYLTGTFASHRDKAFAEEVSRAAKLTQAAFSGVMPPALEPGQHLTLDEDSPIAGALS